jgi:hypothetical protein
MLMILQDGKKVTTLMENSNGGTSSWVSLLLE